MLFTDPNYASIIIDDANNGDGNLLAEMSVIMPSITMSGLSEEEAADLIAEEAVEVQLPEVEGLFYNPYRNLNIDIPNFN